MTARTGTTRRIGEIALPGIGGGHLPPPVKPEKIFRSGQPVWRNSYYEGQLEDRLWKPIGVGAKRGTKRNAARYLASALQMAKRVELRTRRALQGAKKGVRNGAIGAIGIAVLEVLYEMVDYATGRLEPAIGTIAEKVGHSYSAVHEALVRLRRQGFLQWIRRSRPTENKGEAGPQVEQIPNAYVLTLPEELETIARRLIDDGPVPDDEAWRRKQGKADWKAMVDQLSATDLIAEHWAGDRLQGETFARIAALIDARDGQKRESGRTRETGGSF